MTIRQKLKPRRSLFFALAAFGVFVIAATAACSDYDDGGSTATPSAPDIAPLSINSSRSELGEFLTGPSGNTLYVFTKDSPNASNCTAGCLAVWPPLLIADGQ